MAAKHSIVKEVRGCGLMEGAADGFDFQVVACFADAGGVDEDHWGVDCFGC